MVDDPILRRICRQAGVPDLVEALSERIPPTDLQTLLLGTRRPAAVPSAAVPPTCAAATPPTARWPRPPRTAARWHGSRCRRWSRPPATRRSSCLRRAAGPEPCAGPGRPEQCAGHGQVDGGGRRPNIGADPGGRQPPSRRRGGGQALHMPPRATAAAVRRAGAAAALQAIQMVSAGRSSRATASRCAPWPSTWRRTSRSTARFTPAAGRWSGCPTPPSIGICASAGSSRWPTSGRPAMRCPRPSDARSAGACTGSSGRWMRCGRWPRALPACGC